MSEREIGNETKIGMEAREPEALDAQSDAFELRLTQALRRVDAPDGFAARVMERAVESANVSMAQVPIAGPGAPDMSPGLRARVVVMPRRWTWVGGAVAAMLALGVFGVEQTHVRHEREQAALAQQQFETATRITDQTLEHMREQLARAGVLRDLGLRNE